jgi:putative sterol carrier protein
MAGSWKVDSAQPIDEDLKDRILDKIDEGSLGMEDLRDFFTVFTQISNNTEDIQDEVEGFNRTFRIRIDGEPYAWLAVRDKKFEMGSGDIQGAEITLEMSGQLAFDIFSGRVDPTAAYMNGDLKVDGVINDAIMFRTILDLVQEELE